MYKTFIFFQDESFPTGHFEDTSNIMVDDTNHTHEVREFVHVELLSTTEGGVAGVAMGASAPRVTKGAPTKGKKKRGKKGKKKEKAT